VSRKKPSGRLRANEDTVHSQMMPATWLTKLTVTAVAHAHSGLKISCKAHTALWQLLQYISAKT